MRSSRVAIVEQIQRGVSEVSWLDDGDNGRAEFGSLAGRIGKDATSKRSDPVLARQSTLVEFSVLRIQREQRSLLD